MHSLLDTSARILEIEARQDEAIRQLTDLERQVEQVLAASLPLARQALAAANSLAVTTLRREAA